MASFTASNSDGYQGAMALIHALRRVGIEAGITAGGVWVECIPEKIQLAKITCEKNGGKLECGPTAHQTDVLLRSKDGWEILERSTNDAIALKQEWVVED